MIIAWTFFILGTFFWLIELVDFYLEYKKPIHKEKSNINFWFWFIVSVFCAQHIWG